MNLQAPIMHLCYCCVGPAPFQTVQSVTVARMFDVHASSVSL